MAVYTTGTGSSRKSSQAVQEKKKKEEEEKKRKEEQARAEQQKRMLRLQQEAASAAKKKTAASGNGTATVRKDERGTGNLEHDLAIVQARVEPYSRPSLSRQNARQQKTESYMDMTTANEGRARAGIEMYKARSDAQKYAEMNKVGYRNYDQDSVNRSVKGYEESYQRWKKVYDANKGPAAIDPKTSRQSEIRAQAQTIQRYTDTGTGGKNAREDDKRWAGVTSELKRLGRQQRNVDTPGAKRTWAEENRPDEVRSRYQDLYDKTFRRDEPEQKAQTVSERYTAANGQLRAAERDAYYWEQAAKDASWFGDEQRFTRSLPHITESGRRAQGALAQFRAASDELAGAVRDEDEKLKQGDLATWYARNLSDDEIRRRLEEEKSRDVSVTDRDRAENPGMYPDAAFRTMPRQASFDPTMTAGGEAPGNRFYMTEEEKQLTEQSDRYLLQQKVNDREVQIAALERAQQAHHERDLEQEVYGYALRGHLSDMAKQGQDALRQDIINARAHGSNPIDVLAQSGSAEEALALFRGASAVTRIWRNLMKCSDDQKERVYAMYSVDPQKAVELSQKYYDDAMDAYYAQFYNWANSKHGWQAGRRLAAGLLGTGAKLLSGFDPFGDSGQDLSRTGEAFISGGAASASRNGIFGIEALGGDESPISSSIPYIGRGRAGEAYQLGTSVLESAGIAVPAMLIGRYDTAAAKVAGFLGTTLMGSSAAADDYRECLSLGMSDSQALWHAACAGVAEAGFEYWSLDKLIDPANIKHGLLRMLTQGGIEASEEVCTTIANRISDTVIANFAGTKNAIEREALEYQLHGMSAEEAERKAQNQWLAGLMMDGLGGLFSGIIMGGGSDVLQRGISRINTAADTAERNYGSGNLLALETAGYTDTDTLDALTGYARANGIDVKGLTDAQAKAGVSDQGAAVSGQETQGAETGNSQEAIGNSGRETTDRVEDGTPLIRQPEGLTPSPEGEGFDGGLETKDGGLGSARPTETKEGESAQTRRTRAVEDAGPYEERNAERDATEAAADNGEKPRLSKRDLRRAGKVRAQIVESLSSQFEGKTAAEQAAAYDSLVETYGSGIEAAASEALYNTARRTMQGAENVPTLEQQHGTDAEAFRSETAQQAVARAYRDTQSAIMRDTGDTTQSSVRSLQAATKRAGDGLTMQAEIEGADGRTQTVDIIGWNKAGTKVVLQDGTQADVDSLQADAATKDLLEAMKDAKLGAYADEAFQTFVTSGAARSLADGHSWIAGYRGAFGVGEVRGNVTQAVQLAARYGVDMETAAAAYYNGVKAVDADTARRTATVEKAVQKSGKAGVSGKTAVIDNSRISWDELGREQKDQKKFLDKVAQAYGVDVVWFDSAQDGKLGAMQGKYQDGAIWLDVNAGKNAVTDSAVAILGTMGHEMTHMMQDYSPKLYQEYRDFALDSIRSVEGEAGLERMIQDRIDNRNRNIEKGETDSSGKPLKEMSREEAIDEVVARFSEKIFSREESMQARLKDLQENHKDLWQRIKDFFKGWLDKVRKMLQQDTGFTKKELQAWDKLSEEIQKQLAAKWGEGAADMARNLDLTEGVKLSEVRTTENAATEGGEHALYAERDNFAVETPVEAKRDLIAVHNMTEQNLRDVLELGGFPSPSIAIVKAVSGHTNYGPISVVFGRESIDPALDRRNRVYGADAWTPTARNSRTETEVDGGKRNALDNKIWELSKKVANGTFANSSALTGRLGYGATEYSLQEILDRVSTDPSVIAAYLADNDIKVEPVMKDKQFDERGNDFLRSIIDRMGAQELADADSKVIEGYGLTDGQKAIVQEAYRADYYSKLNSTLKEKYPDRAEAFADNAVKKLPWGKEEEFIRNAWAYYEDNGSTKTEIDYSQTLEAMKQAIDPEHRVDGLLEDKIRKTVGDWLKPQVKEILGKKGIYNGKDMFTPAGNRRSFWQLHDEYTLENIVKAMNRANDRGGNTFGLSVGTLQAVSAPEYKSVSQIRADKNRLARVDEESYNKVRKEVEDRIPDIIERIVNENDGVSTGNSFEDSSIIGELIIMAAKGPKTVESVQRVFRKESDYTVSKETAKAIIQLYKDAAVLPTEYFEAKPQRAMGFDEVKAVILPSNIDHEIVQGLQDHGVNVQYFEAGNDTDRTRVLNTLSDAMFSEREADMPSDAELVMGMDEKDADTPEGKALIREVQAKQKQIETLREKLAEAKRQLTTTKRALNTKGIGNVAGNVIRDFGISDAGGKNIKQQATEILTDVYQKALDQIDSGAAAAEAWETVYNGAVEAANLLIDQGRYTENQGGKWTNVPYSRYIGENRQMVIDQMVSEAAVDFSRNRYRGPIQETAADRLVARTEKRMQGKLDETKAKNAELKAENERLEQDKAFLQEQAESARFAAGNLYDQVKDLRQELKDNRKLTAQERKSLQGKIDRLNRQIEAKRTEAAAWRDRANRNASLLKSALESKSRDIQTVKDESQRQVDRAVAEKEAVVRKLEAQIEREQRILAGKLKPPAMQKMLKEARETAAAEIMEKKNAQIERMREGRKASDLRKRIKNLSDEMKRRMTRPTDGAYVPASLYGSMTKLADVLDTVLAPNPGTKAETRHRAMMDAIHSLAAEYDGIKNLDDYTYASEFDQEIRDQISELERVLNKDRSWTDELTGDGKRVGDLSLTELQQTYDILRQINQTMKNAAKLMNSQKLGSLYDAMRNVADQQAGMRSRNASNAFTRGMRNWRLDTMSTMRAVEKMSGWDRNAALYQLMQGIEQGVVNSDIWMMNYNKRMEALKTGKNELEYRKALSKKLDYGVKDTQDGIPVMMTKLQALQILMTAEREAANDKLVHLQKGGAVIRDAVKVQAGKAAKAASYHIDVTPELIQKIRDSLTDWDRQYMQAVHDYFKTESREMNQILYSLKNRVLETEEAYVPYVVDSNYLETKLDSADAAMNMWVKTPGSTNALKTKASQPVIIDGMDTVMAKHVRESADYIGLALPIRDFSKVYNGMLSQGEGEIALPVKKTIADNWGDKGAKLLTDAVRDVQGSARAGSYNTFIAASLNKLQSGFVKSALLINPSVTIKQAASYIAAESVLSHRALIAGNRPLFNGQDASHSPSLIAQIFAAPSGKTATRIYNEIDEHTSMHYVRRQGMSYTELANEANRQGWLQRNTGMIGARMEQNAVGHGVRKAGQALNPVQWIQRMDVATTAALWVACKEQAKMDGMEAGTNEYWSHVTELYEQTLRETQPMYDNLHRTNMQKEKTGLMQFLFPFRTVPVQNHGQIAASFDAMLAAKGKSREEQIDAYKHFAKTVWAQTESAVIFSVMTFLAAGLKRKTGKYRDEDDEISPESILKGILSDTGGVWLSNILPMTGSEIWSWGSKAINSLKGVPNGYTFDTFSVGVVDMLNDLSDAADRMFKAIGKAARGEISFKEFSETGDDFLATFAKLAGIPATTIKTYAEGLWGDVQDIREGRIPAFNDEAVERKNSTNARRFTKAWNAKDEAKMDKVLDEMFGNKVRTSDAAEGARDALSAAAKEAYQAGKMDMEEYVAFLKRPECFTDKGITSRITDRLKEDFIAGKRSAEETVELLLKYKDYKKNPEQSAWSAVKEWAAKAEFEKENGEDADDDDFSFSQYDELNDAVAADENVTAEIQELKAHGYTDKQINDALKKSIQEAFAAGNYTEGEAIDALVKYGVTYSQNGKTVAYDQDKGWQTVREWAAKAGHEDDEDFSYSLYDDLRDAVAAGKGIDAAMKELTDHGVKEADVNKQINNAVKDLYTAGEITEKQAISLLTKYHKVTENKKTRAQTADEAWAAIQEWTAKAAHEDDDDYSYSKYEKIDAALDKNADVTKLIKELTDHGEKASNVSDHIKSYLTSSYVDGKMSEDAFKNRLSRYCGITKTDEVAGILKDANCKKDCGYGWSDLKNAYGNGDLSASAAKKMLQKHGGLSAQGAEHRLGYWDYCKKNPDTKVSAESWDAYYDKTLPTIGGTLSSRGLKQNSFTEYLEKRARLEITDLDGDGKNDKKAYYVSLIDSLNISSAEKDALYYYENYGAKDLRNMPWH